MVDIVSHTPAEPGLRRHVWLVSLMFPMTPLWGTGLAWATGHSAWLWLPVIVFYILVPILDLIIGEDKHDLLGLADEVTSISAFYKFMVHALLPGIYLTWMAGAAYIATQSPGIWGYLALILSHGWGVAFAINAGHETGHKTDKFSKWVALLMLAPAFLGHFRIEHNAGHHAQVATPADHATSRFGESFYAFVPREILGAWKRSWALESKRASRKGYSRWSLKNEVIAATLMQIILFAVITAVFGLSVLPYLIGAAFIGTTALSAQNFIAHYGLLRDKRPDGKFLPCRPEHSWNTNSFITNLTSYNLARHSDHHAHPSRHYQHLRNFTDVPTLPYGYMTMYWIAYVPPLFRHVMDPLVLANVDGDMSKVLTPDMVK